MNKKRVYESMMNNIAKSLKSVLNEGTYVMTSEDKENYPHLYKTINEGAVVRQIEQAKQFAIRVRNIANYIERDCKSYDETWALGYAEQLKNAAEKMLNTIK